MTMPNRIIRRPDSTLIVFGEAPAQAYKLSQPDVGRVEQQYGRPLDFVGQDELESALDGLRITQLPFDAADRAALGPTPVSQAFGASAPTYPASRPAPVVTPASPLSTMPAAGGAGGVPPTPYYDDEPEPSRPNRWLLIGAALLTIAAVLICALVFFNLRVGRTPAGTPTPGLEGTTVAPTAEPGIPRVVAITDAPVYTGPGSVYATVGTMLTGQTAEVVGRSADHGWWVIRFPAAANGQGWVAATLVQAENTDNVPIVAVPPTPKPTGTPAPPTAVISGPTEGMAGSELTFSGEGSAAAPGSSVVNYSWDFGNGATAQGRTVTVIYQAAGNYQVTLTMTDDRGLQGQVRQAVTIVAPTATTAPAKPPVAAISAPTEAVAGATVTFDGSRSSGAAAIVRYTWDFSDGSGANGMVIDHTFHQPGTYTVMLYVQDANGLVGSTSQPIQIVAAATPVPTQPPPTLHNTNWVLATSLTGTSITLAFQAEELTGFAGCNTYTGAYTTDGADLHISNLQVTQQACAPETMAQEQLYLAGLANAFRFSIADHQLTIVTGSPSLPVLLTYNAAPN